MSFSVRPIIPAVAVLCFISTGAYAAGFETSNNAPSALGSAYGGAAAGSGNPESQYFNPATLSLQNGPTLAIGGALIQPFIGADSTTATTAIGTPVVGIEDNGNIAQTGFIPSFYAATPLAKDITFGLGISSPWGLSTSYEAGWEGRYHAQTSGIKSINFTPALAYKINDQLSIGAGLQVQYLDARFSNAVDCGTIDAAFLGGALGLTPGTTASDCTADLNADSWDHGFTAGFRFTPRDGTSLGLSYRSAVNHNLKGDVRYDRPAAALAAILPDGGAIADVETPAITMLGLKQQLTPRLTAGVNVHYTQWSSIDSLEVNFDSGQATDTSNYNWDDVWFVGAGLEYDLTSNWLLRTGAAYDQSPIPDESRNPRLPTADRYWLTVGTGYQFNDALRLDASYVHSIVDDNNDVALQDSTRGNVNIDYDDNPNFNVFTLQATIGF